MFYICICVLGLFHFHVINQSHMMTNFIRLWSQADGIFYLVFINCAGCILLLGYIQHVFAWVWTGWVLLDYIFWTMERPPPLSQRISQTYCAGSSGVFFPFPLITNSTFWFQCLNILGWRRPWVFLGCLVLLHHNDHNPHFHCYPQWNKSLQWLRIQPHHLLNNQRFKTEERHRHQFSVKGLKL